MSGLITVNNTGEIATTGLTIQDQLQKWNGSSWEDVGNPVSVPASNIAAGGSNSFSYSIIGLTFEPGATYRNKAVITITNGNTLTVYDPEEGTIPNPVPTTGTICGKINQHNGHGYGNAVAYFRNVDTGVVYDTTSSDTKGNRGDYCITLPAGRYVFWADKETGSAGWFTSIDYGDQGVQCIDLLSGENKNNININIDNQKNHHVTPQPTPNPNSCKL